MESIEWTSPDDYTTRETKLYSPTNISSTSYFIQNRTEYFKNLDTLRLKFDLCNIVDKTYNLKSNECNYWHVIVEYRSMAQMYLDTIVTARLEKSCSQNNDYGASFSDMTTFVDLFVVLLATLYLYLVLKVSHFEFKAMML